MCSIRTRRIIAWSVLVAISVMPLFLWVIEASPRWDNMALVATQMGRMAALVGMAALSLTMALSARVRFLEKKFFGLGEMYTAHHLLGVFGFLLLLAHPLALAASYVDISLHAAAVFFLPTLDNIPKLFGILALLLLMAPLLITLFARFRYQVLKWWHRMLGVAFLLGGIHMLTIPGMLQGTFWLKGYMIALFLLGIAAYGYRVILGNIAVRTFPYLVAGVRARGRGMVEIILQPLRDMLRYHAGQVIFLSVRGADTSKEVHPFSLTSSPQDSKLSVLVKALGDYTKSLQRLREGSIARVEGPYGTFSYCRPPQGNYGRQIWVAGGSGIAPFLGMARDFSAKLRRKGYDSPYGDFQIDLYYVVRTIEEGGDIVAELEGLASQTGGRLRVFPYFSEQEGRLFSMNYVREKGGIPRGAAVLLCGPPMMVAAIATQAREAGIPEGAIFKESFTLL